MLAQSGAGLATVLKHLKATDDARFKSLEEAARAIVPSLLALNFRRVQTEIVASRVMTVNGQQIAVPEKTSVISDELMLKCHRHRMAPRPGRERGHAAGPRRAHPSLRAQRAKGPAAR